MDTREINNLSSLWCYIKLCFWVNIMPFNLDYNKHRVVKIFGSFLVCAINFPLWYMVVWNSPLIPGYCSMELSTNSWIL